MSDCIRIGVEGMRTLIEWDKKKRGSHLVLGEL
jgi:hypothetical protein